MEDKMRRTAFIIGAIGIAMIILGITMQYLNYKCETTDKNTDYWVKNCDYKEEK